MVAMTDRAGALLERAQTERELPHPQRLELKPERDAVAIGLSEPTPDDEVLYHGNTEVLYISPEAADALAGYTLTTQDTPEGPALALEPPEPDAASDDDGVPIG